MIFVSEVAKRYASALFEATTDKSKNAEVLEELRVVEKIISTNEDIKKFVDSPLIAGEDKATELLKAFASASNEIKNLVATMASNGRITEWSGLVTAYQARTDESHNVVRGTVRSAAPLGPDQRQAIEARVTQVTGKKVILEYKEDKALIGGLVAEVGSLTFDDSIETQLRLMNEELKRRSH